MVSESRHKVRHTLHKPLPKGACQVYLLNEKVCMKQWQAIALLAMSGFATGTLLAKAANALGF